MKERDGSRWQECEACGRDFRSYGGVCRFCHYINGSSVYARSEHDPDVPDVLPFGFHVEVPPEYPGWGDVERGRERPVLKRAQARPQRG